VVELQRGVLLHASDSLLHKPVAIEG